MCLGKCENRACLAEGGLLTLSVPLCPPDAAAVSTGELFGSIPSIPKF